MTTVFIGGSRAVSRLNAVIRNKLDDLIARECVFLIGDANGADKAVQGHLATNGYRHVVVYCMDACRNNVGEWPTRQLSMPGARRDFAYYAAKDHAMARDAKCGVMLWDGRIKGTLNNIQGLLRAGKKTLVYVASEAMFYKLSTDQDLETLLQRCDPALIQEAQRQIRTKLTDQPSLPELESELQTASSARRR